MLLRRITEHVKAQNWTAARSDAHAERALLEQLHQEGDA